MSTLKTQLEVANAFLAAKDACIDAAIADIKAARTEIRRLEASLEAEKARCSARSYDYVVLHKKYKALSASLGDALTTNITDRTELLLRCKELNMQGVPCYTQGDALLHARTRAVIAQVTP